MIKRCYIDTETTGLDAKKNGILEIGCIIEVDNTVMKEFVIECSPFKQDEINGKALKVNHISREGLYDRMSPKDAYKEFTDILSQYVDRFNKYDKFFFFGYNAPFDSNFLREFFLKNGDKYFGSYFFYPPIDVCILAAVYLGDERARMPNFKLTTVAPMLGVDIEMEKAHGALYDIQITRKMFHQIMEAGV